MFLKQVSNQRSQRENVRELTRSEASILDQMLRLRYRPYDLISDKIVDRVVGILKAAPIRKLLFFEEVVEADWTERVI